MVHLKRFCIEHNKVIKDNQFFNCFPEEPLKIRIIDEVSFVTSTLLLPKLTIEAVWTMNTIGNYKIWYYKQTNGSLAMIKLSVKLKLMTSITKHHMCSFKWENDLVFILFFISVIFMQGGFVNSDIVFGCDDSTHNPSSVWMLSLFTQFSGLTTL